MCYPLNPKFSLSQIVIQISPNGKERLAPLSFFPPSIDSFPKLTQTKRRTHDNAAVRYRTLYTTCGGEHLHTTHRSGAKKKLSFVFHPCASRIKKKKN